MDFSFSGHGKRTKQVLFKQSKRIGINLYIIEVSIENKYINLLTNEKELEFFFILKII